MKIPYTVQSGFPWWNARSSAKQVASVGSRHEGERTGGKRPTNRGRSSELLNRKHWKSVVEPSTAIADYIETFYNPVRRHSSLNYLTPAEYEALHSTETQAPYSLDAVRVERELSSSYLGF